MTTYTARVPQLGARGLPGHQIVEMINVPPGPEDGNVGDIAVQYNDDGSVLLYQQKTEAGWPEDPRQLRGLPGAPGWSPVMANELTEEGLVFRVVDWTGGAGAKPAAGLYVGEAGLVVDLDDALVFGLTGTATNIAFDNLDEAEQPYLPGEPGTVQAAIAAVAGELGRIKAPTRTILTSSTTYTAPAGCTRIRVTLKGAGAGSNGIDNEAAGTVSAASGGGGEGGTCIKDIPVDETYEATVLIGTGGAAGVGTGGTSGSAGGNSTWSDGTSTLTANGGGAPNRVQNTSNMSAAHGGEGGTATGGDINLAGAPGGPAIVNGDSVSGFIFSQGGQGGGGPRANIVTAASGAAGAYANAVAGNNPGAGASGAAIVTGSGSRSGAAGANGRAIVDEFYD